MLGLGDVVPHQGIVAHIDAQLNDQKTHCAGLAGVGAEVAGAEEMTKRLAQIAAEAIMLGQGEVGGADGLLGQVGLGLGQTGLEGLQVHLGGVVGRRGEGGVEGQAVLGRVVVEGGGIDGGGGSSIVTAIAIVRARSAGNFGWDHHGRRRGFPGRFCTVSKD